MRRVRRKARRTMTKLPEPFVITMTFPREGQVKTLTSVDRFSHELRAHVATELKELAEQMLDFAPETMACYLKKLGRYRNTADTIVFDEPEPTNDQA